jgi:hypothetical protein
MNALKDLLVTEEPGERGRDQKLERLENILERFKENEIPIEQCAEVTLQGPLLLLLAQHRSFRICRRKTFCPEENCGRNGSPHATRTWSFPTRDERHGPILDCQVPAGSNQSGNQDDTGKSGEGSMGLSKMP